MNVPDLDQESLEVPRIATAIGRNP